MKHFIKKILSFCNRNVWYIIAYILSICVTIISINLYLKSAIEESYNDLQDGILYGLFENKANFGVRPDSYTIVSFQKGVVPQQEDEDTSSYMQQYGGIVNYYEATSGWEVSVFKKTGNGVIEQTYEPYAVGIKASQNVVPENMFRTLYNRIINDEDNNINSDNRNKVSSLNQLRSRFHYLSRETINYWDGTLLYNEPYGKEYAKVSAKSIYKIAVDKEKVLFYRIISLCIFILLITTILVLIKRFNKKRKNRKSNKRKYNVGITINKSTEEVADVSSLDVEDLLQKINPSNFLSPYDPEKVKIANDLYSALLKADGNETIISMIREKAISELGIQI